MQTRGADTSLQDVDESANAYVPLCLLSHSDSNLHHSISAQAWLTGNIDVVAKLESCVASKKDM